MAKTYLVTGGAGFLGSALVKRLVSEGQRVRVFDNQSRGRVERLAEVMSLIEYVPGDIRNASEVAAAAEGVDSICHLAFVNGTEFFYTKPELVLEVGVKGIINVIDACLQHKLPELVLASSSEVYQNPPVIPTSEVVPLSIPDHMNPRWSYSAGKIISEIMAINYGRERLNRVLIVRPHNVYGPDMGWEHVIPQFVLRMQELAGDAETVRFPIQGSGKQTRSFVFIDDFTDGLVTVIRKGSHLNTYNIGTQDEISIAALARMIGEVFGKRVDVVPGSDVPGDAPRRCPDLAKVAALGYAPKVSLREGLAITAKWYRENAQFARAAMGR